jgi:FkbM family methyltransferase
MRGVSSDPMNPPLTLHHTKTGDYFLPDNLPTDLIARAIKADKVFDQHIVDTAARFIRPGTAVLDVGSCFGQMAVLFSRMVGDDGEVFAFEAAADVYDILIQNIAANERPNIRPVFGAVWDREGETKFYPAPDFVRFQTYGSYGLDPNASAGRAVPTLTIDSLHIERPISFMKVDVQGSDLFAMRGAEQTIRRHRMPIIFEFETLFQQEFGTSLADYLAFIDHIDYRILRVADGNNFLIVPKSFPERSGIWDSLAIRWATFRLGH